MSDEKKADLHTGHKLITGLELTAEDARKLIVIADAFGVKNTDTLFPLFVALHGYGTLYGAIPAKTVEAMQNAEDVSQRAIKRQSEFAAYSINSAIEVAIARLISETEQAIAKAAKAAIAQSAVADYIGAAFLGATLAVVIFVFGFLSGARVISFWHAGWMANQISYGMIFGWVVYSMALISAVPFLVAVRMKLGKENRWSQICGFAALVGIAVWIYAVLWAVPLQVVRGS